MFFPQRRKASSRRERNSKGHRRLIFLGKKLFSNRIRPQCTAATAARQLARQVLRKHLPEPRGNYNRSGGVVGPSVGVPLAIFRCDGRQPELRVDDSRRL